MPLSRSAIHQVAALMAITGLSNQRSASSASRTIDRLVPHCTTASTSGVFTSMSVSPELGLGDVRDRHSGGALEPLDVDHLEAELGEELHDVLVADGLVGRDSLIFFTP